jgi:hypothetical protein
MNLRQVERRAEIVQADIEAALARVLATENEPDEPRKHSIIKFQVQFQPTGQVYTYVAYRAPTGDWYRTGDKEVYDWEKLLDFMYRDITAKRLGVGFYVYKGKVGQWVGRSQ